MTLGASADSRSRGQRAAPRLLPALALAVAAAVILAACASPAGGGSSSGGTPVRGGTAYFADQPLTPPTYIFPLVSGHYFTVTNTSDLQTLLYPPLYWYRDRRQTSVHHPPSIGD